MISLLAVLSFWRLRLNASENELMALFRNIPNYLAVNKTWR